MSLAEFEIHCQYWLMFLLWPVKLGNEGGTRKDHEVGYREWGRGMVIGDIFLG